MQKATLMRGFFVLLTVAYHERLARRDADFIDLGMLCISAMAHTYVAYIDESGDDGLDKPFRAVGNSGGPSKWLVISACLFRRVHTLDAVKWRDEISAKMPERQSRFLHFAKLNHGQKLAAVQTIASKPVRAQRNRSQRTYSQGYL